jgi:hypothetical protein
MCASKITERNTTTDGLSIPFFSAGRNLHSHTLSLTATLTRSRFEAPEWLVGVRRAPPMSPTPRSVEIERGVGVGGVDSGVGSEEGDGEGISRQEKIEKRDASAARRHIACRDYGSQDNQVRRKQGAVFSYSSN